MTSQIRTIRSEPMLATMETTKTRLRAQTGRHSDDIFIETDTMVTKLSTDPVAIEMCASSPTLVLESDTPTQSGMGKAFTMPVSTIEPEVKFTTEVREEEEERDGVKDIEGKVDLGVDDRRVDEEKKVESEIAEEAVGQIITSDIGLEETVQTETVQEGGQAGSIMLQTDTVQEGEQAGSIMLQTDTVQEGEQAGSIMLQTETVQVNIEGGQAGSIMQSQETLPPNMNFDLPEATIQSLPYTPSSPLLPTTMETVALEIQDVISDEDKGVDDEGRNEEGEIEQPLQLSDIRPLIMIRSDDVSEMNISSTEVPLIAVLSGHQLEPGEHQLEVTEHRPQDTSGDGTHILDVKETGIYTDVPSSMSTPLSGVTVSLPSSVPTHLSDPLSSSLPPPRPQPSHLHPLPTSQTYTVHESDEESHTMGGDVGPEAIVLHPPPLSSPYPEEVAGVKEILYTAWIPSPWTQGLLSLPTSQQNLTCPGLAADIKMHDPIAELMLTYFPSAPRKTLPSVESVPMDMTGLRRLVKEGCHHTALELTGRFLSAHGQGLGQAGQPSLHTHKTLQMWAARVALLVAMQQYREAELELAAFGELMNPDLYYQYHTHNYPDKTGSMLPFSMRLLHAQLPSLNGNHQQSLDRLCLMQHTCQEILSEVRRGYLPFVSEPLTPEDQQVADSLWLERLTRVKFSLANTLVAMQDYLLTVEVYESLLDMLPDLQGQLLSLMGRLHLTLGDLPTAQSLFTQAASVQREVREDSEEEEERERLVRNHINQGLVNVFLSRWQLAKDCFESALQLEPNNLTLKNNITVCTFYQGHLKECISELESVVGSCPPSSLQPALFCNLTAAYDLESSSAHSKKLSFLPLLGQYVGEGFPLYSLSLR